MSVSPINMPWQEGSSGLWQSSLALPAKGRRSMPHRALAPLEMWLDSGVKDNTVKDSVPVRSVSLLKVKIRIP